MHTITYSTIKIIKIKSLRVETWYHDFKMAQTTYSALSSIINYKTISIQTLSILATIYRIDKCQLK